ncbi:MAG: hypothetical protein PGN08_07675 [Sphingomonas taxi]
MGKMREKLTLEHRQWVALGAVVLLAASAGGAGAVAMTRPAVEMAPTVATPIARLPASSGIVTVKGRVAEVYGDRFVVQDASGRTMIDAGREGANTMTRGAPVLVQGRYDDGQLRAHFLVGPNGAVEAVGPGPGRRPHDHARPGPDGAPPPPPAAGPGAPPPPPPGAGPAGGPPPAPGGAGAPPPAGVVPGAGAPVPPPAGGAQAAPRAGGQVPPPAPVR